MATQIRRAGRSYAGLTCPHCGVAVLHARLRSGRIRCGRCDRLFEAEIFHPPEVRTAVATVGEAGVAGATPCATHERNASVANCGRCGQFMCALCRIDSDGLTLCPACFDRLSAEGALPSVCTTFRDHAGSARAMILLGFLFWILFPITGLAAVVYGVKALRQKKAMGEGDGVVGIYVTLVIAVLQCAGGALILMAMFGAFR